jgi:hypothetical protein
MNIEARKQPETFRCREWLLFIVQAKPRGPAGIIKVVKDTRIEALATAVDLLDQGLPFVTIVADGRVYRPNEFALTIQSDSERRSQKD